MTKQLGHASGLTLFTFTPIGIPTLAPSSCLKTAVSPVHGDEWLSTVAATLGLRRQEP